MAKKIPEQADAGPQPAGLGADYLRDASELMLSQFRAATEMAMSAGRLTMGADGLPSTEAAAGVLAYLQKLAAQTPLPSAQLDLLIKELQAKRALIGALQLQLGAFEQQLEMMEKSLQPLQEWGQQWSDVQKSLTDAVQNFRIHTPEGGPA